MRVTAGSSSTNLAAAATVLRWPSCPVRCDAAIPGYSGHVTWSRNGETVASVSYAIEMSGVRLTYTCQSRGGSPEEIDDLVPVVTTATRFGGRRHWFCCPS